MDPTPTPDPAPRPSGPQMLLGLFILWQLFFLLSTNFIDLAGTVRDEIPRDKDLRPALDRMAPGWLSKEGHVNDLSDVIYGVDKRWAQLTGQIQGWSLFAPTIGRNCVFPAVVLRWDEDPLSGTALAGPLAPLASATPLECAALSAAARHYPPPTPAAALAATRLAPLAFVDPLSAAALLAAAPPVPPPPRSAVTLLSDNEPGDLTSYLRIGQYRLRRYEGNLVLTLRPWTEPGEEPPEDPEETVRRYRRRIHEHIREYGDYIKAYLKWRLDGYLRDHPGTPPPKQVILLMRRWTIAPPDKAPPYWRGPFVEPVARWQPGVVWEYAPRPVEMYNAVQGRFEPWVRNLVHE